MNQNSICFRAPFKTVEIDATTVLVRKTIPEYSNPASDIPSSTITFTRSKVNSIEDQEKVRNLVLEMENLGFFELNEVYGVRDGGRSYPSSIEVVKDGIAKKGRV